RSRAIFRSGSARHRAQRKPAHRVRVGDSLLPRRAARARRGSDRAQHARAETAEAGPGHRPTGISPEPHAPWIEDAPRHVLKGTAEADHVASKPRRARLAISAPAPKIHGSASSQWTTSFFSVPISGAAMLTTSPTLCVNPLPGAPRSSRGVNIVPTNRTTPSG